MNLKTKFPQIEAASAEPEFRPYFPFFFFFLTTIALVIIYIMNFGSMIINLGYMKVPIVREDFTLLYFVFPWIKAGGLTLANGLSEFSGKSPEPVSTVNYLLTILSLIVMYVVAPTLFFFRWRERRLAKIENPGLSYQLPTVSFIIGSVLLLYVIIPTIPTAIIQPMTFQNLKQAQTLSTNRDRLINGITAIAVNARQYRILPKRLGGGEGTYKGYVLPNELMSTQEGTFTVVAMDDEVVIHVTSNEISSATILVHLGKDGILSQWRYADLFESRPESSPWRRLQKLIFGR